MDTGEGDHSQPSRDREQAPDTSDDEDELIIYCAFSDPVSESDEPRAKFDFTKPVQFVDPVRRSGLPEYKELEAEREKERVRAERRLQRQVAVANGDVGFKLPKVTLRRINAGAPPHKGGQLPRRFFF
jgi:hypothetical protein